MTILKIYAFRQKIQQRTSGPGESTAGVMDLSMRIHPKNYCIFPLKLPQLYSVVQGRAQLGHSSYIVKVAVSRLHTNTSSPGVY